MLGVGGSSDASEIKLVRPHHTIEELVAPFDVELDEDALAEQRIRELRVRHDFVEDDVRTEEPSRERQALLLRLLLLVGRVAVAVVGERVFPDLHQVGKLEADRTVEVDTLAELHLRFMVSESEGCAPTHDEQACDAGQYR